MSTLHLNLERWLWKIARSCWWWWYIVQCTCIYVFGMECKFDQIFQLRDPFVKQGMVLLLYSLICKVGSVRSSSNHVKQLKRRGFGFVGTTNQDLETRLYSTRRQWFRNLLRRPHCDKWITNTAKTISFFCKYSTTLTKCRKQIITTTQKYDDETTFSPSFATFETKRGCKNVAKCHRMLVHEKGDR